MKRWVFLVAGIVLILIGAVWTGQGIGWIKGSFMTGEKLWFLIGLICLVAGIWSMATWLRRRPSKA